MFPAYSVEAKHQRFKANAATIINSLDCCTCLFSWHGLPIKSHHHCHCQTLTESLRWKS